MLLVKLSAVCKILIIKFHSCVQTYSENEAILKIVFCEINSEAVVNIWRSATLGKYELLLYPFKKIGPSA